MNVTVHRGDSLWSIAQSHHTTVRALRVANDGLTTVIHPGEVLHLPDAFVPSTRDRQRRAMQHPNDDFKQQFRSRFNPTGPLKSSNCGPASVAMAVKAYGLEPKGLTVEQSIDRVRKLMTGNTDDHDPTNTHEQAQGARKAGLHAQHLTRDHFGQQLDAQLAAGHMVVTIGAPHGKGGDAYTSQFPRYPKFDGLHAILVVGKTKDGCYVVNDPCSRDGSHTLTAEQLRAFWAGGGGFGTSVWR